MPNLGAPPTFEPARRSSSNATAMRTNFMAKPSRTYDEVVSANRDYAKNFGDKGKLALPPARRFAILTCMDARLDPAKYAGLAEGDAHVIRNAGGRASDDAIACGPAFFAKAAAS